VRRRLRTSGRSILGAYHSHPRSAAVPSATDVAEAYYDREFVYVIVSLEREPPVLRAYRVEQCDLTAEDFEAVS
jgi:[CysO sulfur-carrier protein]-S-L-cysteine hydrolase